ncbi:cyanamide hydratase [Yamadazyma tenuis]|uniref:cyanamide hydratase n=1 Tax=Candida tenuis (strain ATCC 10573 / BCRC 21748 / CBS 615 / JCM 9827 / NBRC 10315 / NRRL Y-1498 / VKM Y-70) TaxID=590646 RepID=G3AYF7_CANTC|nr:uncharacterized protein CANTEDRAFT_112707 [Yamadazyma tenuis ATCC 10573]XP_006684415.1 cyanamide hydratase [Yamadazyma tenuis ATCC 10573]EGV65840.1 hypothetical protein CANTEDRAFT_112707 [Yamadazyma tenuis ATCC 10573]EGV65841.1 cyanamide hydratase [Yamadazyma tenuis ATCC 10573]WEJ95828.1 cyanamide hydratase [Yamadazyma tenuis]
MSKYGFVKVPRSITDAIPDPKPPTKQHVVSLPDSRLSQSILKYAQDNLPIKVLRHSLRVFQYSVAIIKDQFSDWNLDIEVLFVTCLLHDIATTDKNMEATKMSFEFYGGFLSHGLVMEHTGNQDFSEAVAEAIIRHQDLGESGYITSLGLILQISTILDNVGLNTQYIHIDTVEAINEKYPRDGWLGCFAAAIDNENSKKPWGHTSALGVDKFRDDVLANSFSYQS